MRKESFVVEWCNHHIKIVLLYIILSRHSLNTSWANQLCSGFLLSALSLYLSVSLFLCLSISLSVYLSISLSPYLSISISLYLYISLSLYLSNRGQLISCWTLTFIQKDVVFSIQHANLQKVTLAQVICANMNVTMVQQQALRLPSENNTLMDCANANMLDVSLFLNWKLRNGGPKTNLFVLFWINLFVWF